MASGALYVAVLVVPIAASVAVGVATSRVLPRPSGGLVAVWLGAIFAVSTLALWALDRVARRALPLAALLRMTLVFPDHAPSRLGVALRSGGVRKLREWADKAGTEGAATSDAKEITTLLALVAALNSHDRRTRGHSERVRALSMLVADELGLEPHDADRLAWAALLHDIGKLTVPARILNKAGKPDEREWKLLERHPAKGAQIAVPLEAWLGDWYAAIGSHHERYDGMGYPAGLAGADIALSARIVSVTDAFETMTATRAYKKPMGAEEARAELVRCAGSHFDPQIVRAFCNISLGRLRWTIGLIPALAQLPFLGVLPRAGAAAGGLAGASSGSITALASIGVLAVGAAVSTDLPATTDTPSDPTAATATTDADPAAQRLERPGSTTVVTSAEGPDARPPDDSPPSTTPSTRGPDASGPDPTRPDPTSPDPGSPVPTIPVPTIPTSATQTFTSIGGVIVVRLDNGVLSLVSSNAAPGFSQEVHDDGPTRVELRFDDGLIEWRIRIDLEDGLLVPEITLH